MEVFLAILLIVVAGCGSGDDDEAESSTTTSITATTTAEETSTTTTEATSTTEPLPVAGSLASATRAVRAACREFYDYDFKDFERLLPEEELAAQCDEPSIEWRSDCYADRPPEFVPEDGGCAYLGGYLAVWHGEESFAEGRLFEVGGDVWTVIPESD